MKTYLKTLWRTFTRHKARFISVIFMVLVATAFISGIGTSVYKIKYSLTDYYVDKNVSDFILKSKAGEFSQENIENVSALEWVGSVSTGTSFDVNLKYGETERLTRLYFLDFDGWTANMFDLTAGEEACSPQEVYAEAADNKISGCAIGETVELNFKDILTQVAEQNGRELSSIESNMLGKLDKKTLTVKGIIQSPLTFARDGEPSYTNPQDTVIPDTIDGLNSLITVENILFVSKDVIPKYSDIMSFLGDDPIFSDADMYVTLKDKTLFNGMCKSYENFIEEKTEELLDMFTPATEEQPAEEAEKKPESGIAVLNLCGKTTGNASFKSLIGYADKVMAITIILMIAFTFVTALVVQSTMTRFVEEERPQVACLKTLGYSSFKIVFKYLLFVLIATAVGGVAAYFGGLGLTRLLYTVFNYSFVMPPMSATPSVIFYIITLAVIVAVAIVATLVSGFRTTGEAPANLLRAKPPKAGKKVFVERIPFIWNALSFKYKSTTRNVLRYKNRFFMTIISVAVATGLVIAGLALLEICLTGVINSVSVMLIAIVVVVFAGLLTGVVIYTLTNINVSERNRELATLMVLGYHDKEVSGYIYREVYIDSIIGIILGYPAGLVLKWLVFYVMDMASTAVLWAWLAAPFAVLLFTFLVTLLLRRKIVGVDMNESLKAIE